MTQPPAHLGAPDHVDDPRSHGTDEVDASPDDRRRERAADRLLAGAGTSTALGRLTELAAQLLSAPSAQVSLLSDEQVVAAGSGLSEGAIGSKSPLGDSLCTVTAGLGRPLVIDDAPADDRVSALPPVTSGAVTAYLGVPLTSRDHTVVGALCVFDELARTWSEGDVALLERLADAVMAELELVALTAEQASSRLRWEVAVEAAGIGSFDWELATGHIEWDERLQELFGYAPGEFTHRIDEAFRRIHLDDREALDVAIAAAVDVCGPFTSEYRIEHGDGVERWVASRGRAVAGADGRATRLLGTAHDITDVRTARRAEQARREAAAATMALLATVSIELAGAALDTDTAVRRLADLVVPALATWSIVTLVDDDDERLRDVGWSHADPALEPLLATYARHRMEGIADGAPVLAAQRSSRPVIVAEDARAAELDALASPEAISAIGALAPTSLVVLPLVSKGDVLGVLSLYQGEEAPALDDQHLVTAVEVAARAALSLDNARLYARQRSLAEGLQRSLLTAPPEPDHGEIVVRYVPAAEVASVGGDWFDSFILPGGATTLVIGDVVGHDTEAAAAMGQVRGLLRGIAWHTSAGPAAVLAGVDAAMQGLQLDTTATVVVARLEQTPEEKDRGETRLRWSNAGHPPPLVVMPDGEVTLLERPSADLLLGIDPETTRAESVVTLERDATIFLYTDGLVERRGQSLDEGIDRLRAALSDTVHLMLQDLCDEVLRRMGGDDDDIAIIAVRLHRQDRPRPPEAGPRRIPPNVD